MCHKLFCIIVSTSLIRWNNEERRFIILFELLYVTNKFNLENIIHHEEVPYLNQRKLGNNLIKL